MSQISKTFFRLAVMPESEKSFVGNFSCFFLLQKMKVSEIYYSARRTYGCCTFLQLLIKILILILILIIYIMFKMELVGQLLEETGVYWVLCSIYWMVVISFDIYDFFITTMVVYHDGWIENLFDVCFGRGTKLRSRWLVQLCNLIYLHFSPIKWWNILLFSFLLSRHGPPLYSFNFTFFLSVYVVWRSVMKSFLLEWKTQFNIALHSPCLFSWSKWFVNVVFLNLIHTYQLFSLIKIAKVSLKISDYHNLCELKCVSWIDGRVCEIT